MTEVLIASEWIPVLESAQEILADETIRTTRGDVNALPLHATITLTTPASRKAPVRDEQRMTVSLNALYGVRETNSVTP